MVTRNAHLGEIRASAVKWLEDALEEAVTVWQAVMAEPPADMDSDLHFTLLERRVIPIIEGVLGALDAHQFAHTKDLAPQAVWRIYWNLNKDPGEPRIPLSEILDRLNRPVSMSA